MAYFEKILIQAADSPSVDAFYRWRTSQVETIFDSKQIDPSSDFEWSTKIIGNATSSFVHEQSATYLISSGSNSRIIRQTKKHFDYQPGKSQFVVFTANFGSFVDGIIKRSGYFDFSDGLFFQQSGSSFGIVKRSSITGNVVDTFVSQSDWNIDKLDGTGISGNVLDVSKSQIYFFDFEWLGVGSVRYGIFQSGQPLYVHEIEHVNSLNSVYMQTPNFPVKFEIINSGSLSSKLIHMCSSVSSEGGITDIGKLRAKSTGPVAGAATINADNYGGLLAIRLKSGSLDATVYPVEFSTTSTAGSTYETSLLLNPLTGSDWQWQDISNSVIQYATASSAGTTANAITDEGTKLSSIYVSGQQRSIVNSPDIKLSLGSTVDGESDTLVVAMRVLATNSSNTFASLTWRESV